MSSINRGLKEFMKNKAAVLSFIILLFLLLVALFADFISPYNPNTINLNGVLQPPSISHPMGTDQQGRDMLSRVIYGTRVTFEVSIVIAVVTAVIGVSVGIIAGYYGGIIDEALMRLTDVFWAYPSMLFALLIVGGMGSGITNTILAISITEWLFYSRVIRASTLSIKAKEFVEGARAMGFSDLYICYKYIFINCIPTVIVLFTLDIGSIIITVASLGFLGLGVQPPTPEWGTMLGAGQALIRNYPWISLFPGLMIMITVLAFNFLGDGLRDALDPRQIMIK